MDNVFSFKSVSEYYDKEKAGLKNNTVREFDLMDERHTQLIAWMHLGFNKGDVRILIENPHRNDSFIRDIRDISIWNGLLIITWDYEEKLSE